MEEIIVGDLRTHNFSLRQKFLLFLWTSKINLKSTEEDVKISSVARDFPLRR
jgi:hypothetical protein